MPDFVSLDNLTHEPNSYGKVPQYAINDYVPNKNLYSGIVTVNNNRPPSNYDGYLGYFMEKKESKSFVGAGVEQVNGYIYVFCYSGDIIKLTILNNTSPPDIKLSSQSGSIEKYKEVEDFYTKSKTGGRRRSKSTKRNKRSNRTKRNKRNKHTRKH